MKYAHRVAELRQRRLKISLRRAIRECDHTADSIKCVQLAKAEFHKDAAIARADSAEAAAQLLKGATKTN